MENYKGDINSEGNVEIVRKLTKEVILSDITELVSDLLDGNSLEEDVFFESVENMGDDTEFYQYYLVSPRIDQVLIKMGECVHRGWHGLTVWCMQDENFGFHINELAHELEILEGQRFNFHFIQSKGEYHVPMLILTSNE